MRSAITFIAVSCLANATFAGYLIQIDIDGADDGPITYNADFSFGGDTNTASTSVVATAFGTTPGDSIFGGNGTSFGDTYVYTYSPDSQADNLVIPPGQDLGDGNVGTGLVGGGSGPYAVYALWPFTENVGGGLTTYNVTTAGDNFSVQLDQNNQGDAWVYLGDINYTSGAITVEQVASSNSFVSMRAYGVLFEAVPEPSAALLLLAASPMLLRRRRS